MTRNEPERDDTRGGGVRNAEERFAQLLAMAPDAIISVDESGLVESFNRAAEQIFGYAADEVLGRSIEILIPERYRGVHENYMAEFARSEVTGRQMGDRDRIYGLRKDGTEFPAEASISNTIVGGERLLTVMMSDASQRLAQEEALRQSQKLEAVGQLTGGIAHDFNNILMVVMGNLDILEATSDLKKSEREMLTQALEAAERGQELVRHLLSFARRQTLQAEVVDLTHALRSIFALMPRVLGSSVDLVIEIEDGLWSCEVDTTQLQTALLNLAINASDAMPDGGVLHVEVSNAPLGEDYAAVYPYVQPGDFVLITVADSGTGIPKETLERVFEPFFTTKEIGKGTGLGLSMVYGFVKQSGGHINVYSQPGHGTAVHLYLPRSLESGEVASDDVVDPSVPSGNGESILVVEDDPVVRSLFERMLQGLNYRVETVGGGHEALRVLRGRTFDLLLTDLGLPGGMSGADLAREAHALQEDLRVMYSSGHPAAILSRQERLEAQSITLTKPFTRSLLARRIATVLHRH